MIVNFQNLKTKTTIKDENGHELPAIKVFSLAIRFLREDLKETLRGQMLNLDESHIRWVLTVPAIWNEKAKQFMRMAAVEEYSLSFLFDYCFNIRNAKQTYNNLTTMRPYFCLSALGLCLFAVSLNAKVGLLLSRSLPRIQNLKAASVSNIPCANKV